MLCDWSFADGQLNFPMWYISASHCGSKRATLVAIYFINYVMSARRMSVRACVLWFEMLEMDNSGDEREIWYPGWLAGSRHRITMSSHCDWGRAVSAIILTWETGNSKMMKNAQTPTVIHILLRKHRPTFKILCTLIWQLLAVTTVIILIDNCCDSFGSTVQPLSDWIG